MHLRSSPLRAFHSSIETMNLLDQQARYTAVTVVLVRRQI
jgi:hypothetical protein